MGIVNYFPVIYERGIIGFTGISYRKSDLIFSAKSGHTNSKYRRINLSTQK